MSTQAEASSRRRLSELPAFLTPDRLRVIFAFGAVVLVFAVGDILHPGFASAGSVKAILLSASFVGFVAAGQTFVVLIGGIDLSVPWVLNGAAILFVTTSLGCRLRTGGPLPLALVMGWPSGGNGIAVACRPAVVITPAMNGVAVGQLWPRKAPHSPSCASATPGWSPRRHVEGFGSPLGLPWLGVPLITFPALYTTSAVSHRSATTRRRALAGHRASRHDRAHAERPRRAAGIITAYGG
jgi:ribose transport system permease protein